ncbi:hypothetical protein [Lysobacter gummosus]|uniref:hypothetical protein n=1 Tax=Lysobacter gummosus TaxID=262324 RepID=UPI003638D704
MLRCGGVCGGGFLFSASAFARSMSSFPDFGSRACSSNFCIVARSLNSSIDSPLSWIFFRSFSTSSFVTFLPFGLPKTRCRSAMICGSNSFSHESRCARIAAEPSAIPPFASKFIVGIASSAMWQ